MTQPVRRGRSAHPVWDPFREIEDLRTRMDRLMHATFPVAGFPEFDTAEVWAPLADVEDTEDAYLVELELPGVEKDQITVEVGESELDVHGEIKEKERTGVVRSTPAASGSSTTARPFRRTRTPSTSARI